MNDYIMYTDGGSRGNPGIAGAGAVIMDGDENVLKELSQPLGTQTNNYAEYEAILLAFEGLKRLVKKDERKKVQIEVRVDSELIQKQLSNEYQIKEENLFGQYIRVHNLLVSEFPNVTFVHVRRENNKHADALANQAMDHG